LYSGLHVHAADHVNATVYAGYTSDLVNASVANSDFARIRVGGANNAGYMEIATGDDGTEPIYVRQYTGANVTNQVTLLDGSGNTTFPKQVTATGFTGSLTGTASTAKAYDTSFTGSNSIKLALDGKQNTLTVMTDTEVSDLLGAMA
jgi:hypothetical protein